VTEQIDAMRSMGADPVRALVMPRVLAAVITLPILTAVADAVGIAAAMVMANLESGVPFARFYYATIRAVTPADLLGGLGKAAFFGGVISLIACNHGLSARGGTDGVGRATTRTVVHPGGGVGAGRSPTTSAARGSSVSNDDAYAARMGVNLRRRDATRERGAPLRRAAEPSRRRARPRRGRPGPGPGPRSRC